MQFILSTSRKHRLRGITIIEVLTSIVVAMIGVFGVMILIPFATRQAERGLDRDVSTSVGRSAFHQMQIEGYYRIEGATSRWADGAASTLAPVPAVVAIDPLFVTESDGTGANFGVSFLKSALDPMPPMAPATPPAPIQIPIISLASPSGAALSQAAARQLCRSTDDLVFEMPDDDLDPPQQVYDIIGPDKVRRQSRGEFSWSAVAVPVKDRVGTVAAAAWKYRMSVLVYKDRVISDDLEHRFADVDLTAAIAGATDPIVGFSGGVLALQNTPSLPEFLQDVRKDDWVMMINEIPGAEPGFNQQIGFYQVVGVDAVITLDGPDFVFSVDNPTTGMQQALPTRIIALNGIDPITGKENRVVNVYERTFRWEQTSVWNQ